MPLTTVQAGANGDAVASLASDANKGIPFENFSAKPRTAKVDKHNASGVTQIEIEAPRDYVWKTLTNFDKYPCMFKRIKSCRVTRRDGNLVYTETHLKSIWLISDGDQRAVNDLAGAPNTLTWQTIGGNFNALDGKWDLKQVAPNRCIATYTLELNGGAGAVPAPLVSLVLRSMQKEIVGSLKKSVESSYQQQRNI